MLWKKSNIYIYKIEMNWIFSKKLFKEKPVIKGNQCLASMKSQQLKGINLAMIAKTAPMDNT